MSKLNYFLILLFTFGIASAQEKLTKEEKERREKNIQAGNPFAKYGYKAKVATLSKGKYLEVHDLDSIVTIGTVRFNVDNEQIVGNVEIDSLNPDAQPVGDITGRWISPDPLSEEFLGWSPYNFCYDNPVRFVDPDGMAAGDPVGPGYYTASSNTRMVGFSLRHPIAAGSIGSVSHGSTNISTNSARFAINTGLPENRAMEGSHINAFRHTLWQAKITNEFGAGVAKEAGNTHEENPTANLKQTSFKTLSDADQTIDLLNNQIGRDIGKNNPDASMQDLAIQTLNYFNDNGLYTATKQKDGSYSIGLTKLTPEQYSSALKTLTTTNQNGYTPTQQAERNAEVKAETDKARQQAQAVAGPKI